MTEWLRHPYKAIRQFKINDIIEQAHSARTPSPQILRLRRTSLFTQNEDQDPWGYAKPSTYGKVSPSSIQEQQKLLTPAQQLTSDAKLFTRFLAAINKSTPS